MMFSIFNPPHSVKQDPVKPANQIIVTCRREGALAAHQAPVLQGETLRANRPERLRHSPCSMKHQVNISTATLYTANQRLNQTVLLLPELCLISRTRCIFIYSRTTSYSCLHYQQFTQTAHSYVKDLGGLAEMMSTLQRSVELSHFLK